MSNNTLPDNEKRIYAAIGIIFDKDKRVLLSKRDNPHSSFSHGKWQFPGGGIEFGEHPKDTVVREVKEEVGVDVKLLSPHPFVHHFFSHEGSFHIIVFGYPALHTGGEIDVSGDPDTSEARWFQRNEINFSDNLPLAKEFLNDAYTLIQSH